MKKNNEPLTSATRQVRQQWFSVCIFPLGLLFGLIPSTRDNPPLRVASYVGGKRNQTDSSLQYHMEKQIDNTKFIIQRFDNHISGANVKGNFLLAFNTFLTGGIIANYSKIKELVVCELGINLLNIILCLLMVASVITFVIIIKAVYPFLESGNSAAVKPDEENPNEDKYHSHIFFNSIAEFESDTKYFESFSKLSDNDFKQDLSNQAFQLAKGLKKKYKDIERAMCMVYFELFLILSILILIIIF